MFSKHIKIFKGSALTKWNKICCCGDFFKYVAVRNVKW